MEKFTQAPVGLDIDQTVSSNSDAIAKLDSNSNYTNDILADALLCTRTTFFYANGGSYTGSVPNNNYKYGTFLVNMRNGTKTVIAQSENNDIAINTYDGSAWKGWQELATKSDIATTVRRGINLEIPASGSKTLNFTTSWGYSFLIASASPSVSSANGVLWFVSGYVSASRGVAINIVPSTTVLSVDMSSTDKKITLSNTFSGGSLSLVIINLSGEVTSFSVT